MDGTNNTSQADQDNGPPDTLAEMVADGIASQLGTPDWQSLLILST
jgi:hypothetical protein